MHMEFDRVRASTAANVNDKIDAEIENSIDFFSSQSTDQLSYRIDELRKEWSVERFLETNASTLALSGVLLATFVNKKWLWLSGGVLGFLLVHGLKGWGPPLPLLRRLGVRTRGEIDKEMYALKVLRGDFDDVGEREKAKAAPSKLMQSVSLR